MEIARYRYQNSYRFDYIFDTDKSNFDVFSECVAELVSKALQGESCTIFAYGVTGSGKTHTMMGPAYFPQLGLI